MFEKKKYFKELNNKNFSILIKKSMLLNTGTIIDIDYNFKLNFTIILLLKYINKFIKISLEFR